MRGKLYTKEEVINIIKDVFFEARILSSDWRETFYDLDDEANNPDYNPHFKVDKEEYINDFNLKA